MVVLFNYKLKSHWKSCQCNKLDPFWRSFELTKKKKFEFYQIQYDSIKRPFLSIYFNLLSLFCSDDQTY